MSEDQAAPDVEEEKDMEEGAAQGWTWSSWGHDMFKSLTDKSASTFGMVKKDLTEFYNTIQSDTVSVVADTANKVQEQLKEDEEEDSDQSTLKSMKQGFSTVLSKFSDSIKHLAEAGAQTTFMIDDRKDRGSSNTMYDRKEAIIYAIQTNPSTYCNEPDGPQDAFESWLETFDSENYRGEISDLLVQNTDIRAIYIQLVPTVVPHLTFWQRYYYKLHQLEQEESRRAALVARASANHHTEDSYSWGDEDDEFPDRGESSHDPTSTNVHENRKRPSTPRDHDENTDQQKNELEDSDAEDKEQNDEVSDHEEPTGDTGKTNHEEETEVNTTQANLDEMTKVDTVESCVKETIEATVSLQPESTLLSNIHSSKEEAVKEESLKEETSNVIDLDKEEPVVEAERTPGESSLITDNLTDTKDVQEKKPSTPSEGDAKDHDLHHDEDNAEDDMSDAELEEMLSSINDGKDEDGNEDNVDDDDDWESWQ